MNSAAAVKRDAPEAFQAVKQGKFSLNMASKITKLSEQDRTEVLAIPDNKARKAAVKSKTAEQAKVSRTKDARVGSVARRSAELAGQIYKSTLLDANFPVVVDVHWGMPEQLPRIC